MYTVEEQAAHREQWVEALRSGKYEQTKGALRAGDKFCCLGVACDISKLGVWVPASKKYTSVSDTNTYKVGKYQQYIELPDEVMDWLGVSHRECETDEGYLSKINDDGASFSEIADIIESGKLFIR